MDNLIIEDNIVRGCKDKDILKLEIPEGVVAIGDNAFSDFENLYDVILPDSVVKVGSNAFEHCTALKSINHKNVNFIGEYAFLGCSSLHEITFNEDIGYLCNGTFLGCSSIEEIVIPKNITYIGCECFRDCTSLSSVDIQGAMEIDNNAFENCPEIFDITFPPSLIHISTNAFSFCRNLSTVTITNCFIDMDESAFENNKKIVIKAVPYSTAFNYVANLNGFIFKPTIIDKKYLVVTESQMKLLKDNKIMFIMKPITDDKTKIVIVFDSSQKAIIEKILYEERTKTDG